MGARIEIFCHQGKAQIVQTNMKLNVRNTAQKRQHEK